MNHEPWTLKQFLSRAEALAKNMFLFKTKQQQDRLRLSKSPIFILPYTIPFPFEIQLIFDIQVKIGINFLLTKTFSCFILFVEF